MDGDTAVMVPKQAAGASADTARRTLSSEEGQAILKEWYRAETKARLEERIPAMESLTGKHAEKWTVKDTRSQWGSCTAQGNLNFNCLLMLAPDAVIDAVVAHELCHRRHMDHSPAFYAALRAVCPDYDACRAWLRANGPVLLARVQVNTK